MKRNNKKGFTIVELVIVIAVIAILAGVLIPTFSGIVKKAQENAALQEAKTIMTNYTASIDYTKETPEDTYHIVVMKDEKGTGPADDEYYIFTVTNGVLNDKPTTGAIPANKYIVQDSNNDGTVETTPAT
jgi:prepilin-type N-terminal cleavage/methylation domain-containing protein